MPRNTENSTHFQITQLLAESEELIAQAQAESEQQLSKKLRKWNIAHGYMSLLMDALESYTRNLSADEFAADYPNWINQILIQLQQLTQGFEAFNQLTASIAAKRQQDLVLLDSWRKRLFFLIENSPYPEKFLHHYQYIMEADWEKLSDWLSNETTFNQVLNNCLAGLHVSERLTKSEPLATELFKNWLIKLAAIKYYVELGNYFIAGFSAATLSGSQIQTEKVEFYFQRIKDLVQLLLQTKLKEQAVSFIKDNATVFQQVDTIYKLDYANQSRNCLLKTSASAIPINLLEDRKALGQAREYYYKTLLSNTENTYQLQQGLSNDIQQLVAVILQRCLAWLGPAPITFCIIKLGSGARTDSSFYSDLECGLVLARKIDTKNKLWFEHFLNFFRFHMTCFGEHLGFRLDEGGDLRDDTSIGTIEELLQRNFTYDNDPHKLEGPLTASLLNPAFLFGCDEGSVDQDTQAELLLQDFQKQIYAEQQKIISLPDKPSCSLQRLRAQAFLTTHVDIILKKDSEWNFIPDMQTDLYFDLKKHFIQPLTCLLLDLAWYYDFPFSTMTQFLNDYQDNGFNQLFSVSFFKELITALQQAQRFRLLAHYQAKYQQDRVKVISDNNSSTQSDNYLLKPNEWVLLLNIRARILEPLANLLRYHLISTDTLLPLPTAWDPAIDYYKKITDRSAPILVESMDWNSAIYSLISTLWLRQAEKKQYRDYYRMLPDEKRPLFITTLIQIGETLVSVYANTSFLTNLLEQLKWIPTATGERTTVLERRKAWEQRLYNMTDDLDASKIKVQWITPNGIVTRSLKPEIAQQIIDEQGKLKPRLKEIPGRRWARPLATQAWNSYDELKEENIIAFVKQPELPGMQVSIETLIHRLSGLAGYSTPVRVFLPQQTKPLVLLFSNYSGKTLFTLRSEKADIFETVEKKLDPYAFTMKHFETSIIAPGDDKDDNVATEPAILSDEESLQLISFDNEQGLLDAVVKNDFLEEKLEVRTLVYLLTAMNNPISEESSADILHLDAAALLKAWFTELQHYNTALFNDDPKLPGLFTLSEIQILANDKNQHELCFLPALLITGDLARLYKAIQRYQNLLQEPANLENHWDILHYQEQKLGHYYEEAYKKEDNLHKRFASLPTNYKVLHHGEKNNAITYHQSTIGKPQERMYASLSVVNEKKRKDLKEAFKNDLATALRDNLKKCQTTELEPLITYYNKITQIQNELYNGNLSSFSNVEDYIKEKMLKHLNWLQVVPAPSANETTEQYQQAILKTIVKRSRKTEFNELIFENCVGLTDSILKQLLDNSPTLTRITLIACSQLTKEGIALLIKHAPLQIVELKALPQLIQLKVKRGNWKQLRRLSIRDCIAIAAIEMDVPLLQQLLLQQLTELKIVRIKGPLWLNSTIIDCAQVITSELPQLQPINTRPKKFNSLRHTKSWSPLKSSNNDNATSIQNMQEKCLTFFDNDWNRSDIENFLAKKQFDTFCLIGKDINVFNINSKEGASFYQIYPNEIDGLGIQCLIKLSDSDDKSILLKSSIPSRHYDRYSTTPTLLAKLTFEPDELEKADVLVFCVPLIDSNCLEKIKKQIDNIQQSFILLNYSTIPIPVIIVGIGEDLFKVQTFAKTIGAEHLQYLGHDTTWHAIMDIAVKYKLQACRKHVLPGQVYSINALSNQLYLDYDFLISENYQKQLLHSLQHDQRYSEIYIYGENANTAASLFTRLLKTNHAITDITLHDSAIKPYINCAVLGSGGVGKTALIRQYVERCFYEETEMTLEEESYRKFHSFCDLEILDTAGTESYTAMRDLYIKKGHVFILPYSIIAQSTFNDVPDLYDQILRLKDRDYVPCILVGMKSDLHEQRAISYEKGANLAAKLGVVFMECSAKTVEGPDKIFETAIKLALNESLAMRSTKKLKYSLASALKLNQELRQQFYTSIVSGNVAQVKQCLVDGVSLYAPLHDKETALHVAMRAGNLEIAEIVLEHCVAKCFAIFAHNYFSDISTYIADPDKKAQWKLLFSRYERRLNQAIFYSNMALPHIKLASLQDIKSDLTRERSPSWSFWKSSRSEEMPNSFSPTIKKTSLQEKCLTLFDDELALENKEDLDKLNAQLQNYNALCLMGNRINKLIELAEANAITSVYSVILDDIKTLSLRCAYKLSATDMEEYSKEKFYSSPPKIELGNLSISPTIVHSVPFQPEELKNLDVMLTVIKVDETNYKKLISNAVHDLQQQFISPNNFIIPIPVIIINTGKNSANIEQFTNSLGAEYMWDCDVNRDAYYLWQSIAKITLKHKLQARRIKLTSDHYIYNKSHFHPYNHITHPSQLYLSIDSEDKKYLKKTSKLLSKDHCYNEIYIFNWDIEASESLFTLLLKTNRAITDIILHTWEIKCVVMGGDCAGKTALITQGVLRYFFNSYDPTIEDSYRKFLPFCVMEILDTAGPLSFCAMRDLYMKNGEVFILVYSINSQVTFDDQLPYLYNEILRVKEKAETRMVLVGMKTDLENQRVISYEAGASLARQWGIPFFEYSAKSEKGVDEIFETAAQLVFKERSTSLLAKRLPTLNTALEPNRALLKNYHNAILTGDVVALKKHLAEGVSLYAILDNEKNIGLHLAVKNQQRDIAEILLQYFVKLQYSFFVKNNAAKTAEDLISQLPSEKQNDWKLLFERYESLLNQTIFINNTALPHINFTSFSIATDNNTAEPSQPIAHTSSAFWNTMTERQTKLQQFQQKIKPLLTEKFAFNLLISEQKPECLVISFASNMPLPHVATTALNALQTALTLMNDKIESMQLQQNCLIIRSQNAHYAAELKQFLWDAGFENKESNSNANVISPASRF